MKNLQIRAETALDEDAIYRLNSDVFETNVEALLVNKLRLSAVPYVSLVAEIDGEIVGHIMFTPVLLASRFLGITLKFFMDFSTAEIMGLAPLAVLPAHQKAGVGSALVVAGFEACRKLGFGAVVVLGHPEYYPKFGFKPSVLYSIDSEYRCPTDNFMAVELVPDALKHKSGRIVYNPAFMEL